MSVLGAVLSLSCGLCFSQPDPRAIDQIRYKPILDQQDLQTIDGFVASVVRQIVRAQDFSQISRTRALLISKKGTQAQYAQQFTQSCYKHIAAGLQQATDLPEPRRFLVRLNLLIMADGLQEAGLAELAIPYIQDSDPILQYWAVRVATNKAVVDRFRQGGWTVAGQIISQLSRLTGSSDIEKTLDLTWIALADFASKIGPQQGDSLLNGLADMRLRMYRDGKGAVLAQVDTVVLKQLATFIQAQRANDPAMTRRFAQLYSYAIQYLAKAWDKLDEKARYDLISLVVEVEERCIAPAIQGYQASMRKAIESGDLVSLMSAHDALLGSLSGPGRLASVWPFDYGPGQSGGPRHWPLVLPGP